MVTTNSTKTSGTKTSGRATAAKAAAAAAADMPTTEELIAGMEEEQEAAPAQNYRRQSIPNGRGNGPSSRGNGERTLRFADTNTQRAYYAELDKGLEALIAGLAQQFDQQEPTVFDDLNDRIIERIFLIKAKNVRAVAAGKAGTGEQMSDDYRNAFKSLMHQILCQLFPGVDPDTLIKMRGLPGINGARFSRMMIQRVANHVNEQYAGTETIGEGYDLLEEARAIRQ